MDRERRRLRLAGFDYATVGAYFVTVSVQGRAPRLGRVADDRMVLSYAGRMVEDIWCALPETCPAVSLDAFVVMPNHLHGIVVLEAGPTRLSLPDLLQRFKSRTTAFYRRGAVGEGWPRFTGRLWQRGYHDHVIRSDDELARIREYVAANPLQWALDRENPERTRPQRQARSAEAWEV